MVDDDTAAFDGRGKLVDDGVAASGGGGKLMKGGAAVFNCDEFNDKVLTATNSGGDVSIFAGGENEYSVGFDRVLVLLYKKFDAIECSD